MKRSDNIFDFFDQSYVINLPSRTDRRRRILRELTRLQGGALSDKIKIFPGIRPGTPNGFQSVGAYGLMLTYLALLDDAMKRGLTNLLIMEDDLIFTPQAVTSSPRVIQELTTCKWDFAYLGHQLELKAKESLFQEYLDDIVTAHFVAIKGHILPELKKYLEEVLNRPAGHPLGGRVHVDGAMSLFRRGRPHLKTLVAVPVLGYQGSSSSDITPSGWWDRNPMSRAVVDTLRNIRLLFKQGRRDRD